MKKILLLMLRRHIIKCLREKGNNGNDFINHVLMALDLPRVGMPKFENPPPPPAPLYKEGEGGISAVEYISLKKIKPIAKPLKRRKPKK